MLTSNPLITQQLLSYYLYTISIVTTTVQCLSLPPLGALVLLAQSLQVPGLGLCSSLNGWNVNDWDSPIGYNSIGQHRRSKMMKKRKKVKKRYMNPTFRTNRYKRRIKRNTLRLNAFPSVRVLLTKWFSYISYHTK